jgi:hypothetical protein
VTLVTFGSEQYVWKNDAENSHADPDGPPVSTVVPETRDRTFVLPKASITVLRGAVEGRVSETKSRTTSSRSIFSGG